MQPLYQSLPADLSDEERLRAVQFIRENEALFSKSEFDIGCTDLVQHRIDTETHRPFRQSLRRHPMAHLPQIDEHVDEMLRHNIIEPAASPWCSNVVLVKKADGGLRFCIDYRQLNELTYKDTYPLPKIDMCLNALGGSRFFSTIDLRAGYWQTLIHERDRDKTCFVTRRGTFRFKVLSFGLANAPALFQRLMDLVLVGLTWEICLVYLDDVIIMSETFDEHLSRLTTVFDRLRSANLKLKAQKCRLFQRQVIFLGHLVTADGIAPDPSKIQAVQNWPRPRNLTETRAFVGLAGYYRNFVADFAAIARPLHELTKKGRHFEWTDRQDEAFLLLKRKLTEAPVLATPRDEGMFYLDTDASDQALGAVLQQEQDGVIKVIGYASRSLSDAERNYCTTRKELLGVIYGLKQYRQFLLARKCFVIRTDHAALTHLMRTPEPLGQQARWLDLLAEYNFKIQHRAGTAHRNSDALSRRPCERDMDSECKQCRPKQRASCFTVQGNGGLIFWNSAVKPPDIPERTKLSEIISISSREETSEKVSGPSGNAVEVADPSATAAAGASTPVNRQECQFTADHIKAESAGFVKYENWPAGITDGVVAGQSTTVAAGADTPVRRSGSSCFAGQEMTRAAGLVKPVSQPAVMFTSIAKVVGDPVSGPTGNDVAVAGQTSVCLPAPSTITESVAGQQAKRPEVAAWCAEITMDGVEVEASGHSVARWSDFPTVTGNVVDNERMFQNPTGREDIEECQCEAAVATADRSVACFPNLSTLAESVAGQRVSLRDGAALKCGEMSLDVVISRRQAAATGDSLRDVSLYEGVNEVFSPSVAHKSSLSMVSESVADNEPDRLKEAEVCQWEAAIGAIVSGQYRSVVEVASHSVACFSDTPTSTWGVADSITSQQNVAALRENDVSVYGSSVAYWSNLSTVTERVADNEQGRQSETVVGSKNGAGVEVVGPPSTCLLAPSTGTEGVTSCQTVCPDVTVSRDKTASPDVAVSRQLVATTGDEVIVSGQAGKTEHVTNVNVVTQADDRSEAVAVSADSDVIHVVNEKKCIDASEINSGGTSFEPENLRLAQVADCDIAPVLRWKQTLAERPSWKETAKYSDTTKNYCAQWNSLEVVDGILYRNWGSANGRDKYRQLVVPYSLRREFVARVHGVMASGHFGIRRTQEQFQRRGYFMNWRRFVEGFCKRCTVCAKFYRGRPPKQSYLQSIDCGTVNERWHSDLSGPYPVSNGYKYICTCVDAFSRYLVASPIRDKSAQSVARVLVRDVIARFGCFQSLVTDNGKEFQNDVIHHICQLLNIDQLRITSYRPSGNGRCEIINKTLHSLLGRVISESQRDWSQWLPICVLAYNTTRHESTGQTPYYLMHSREALIPLDLLMKNPDSSAKVKYCDYVDEMEDRMRRVFDTVRAHQGVQMERMKRYYNVGVKPRTFAVNDLVLYYYPRKYSGRSPKWSRVYSEVYRVEKKINDAVYIIRKTPKSSSLVVNVDKLKNYYGEVPACWKKVISQQSANELVGNLPAANTVAGPTTAMAAGANAPVSRPECQLAAGQTVPISRPAETMVDTVAGQSATVAAGATAPVSRPEVCVASRKKKAAGANAPVSRPENQHAAGLNEPLSRFSDMIDGGVAGQSATNAAGANMAGHKKKRVADSNESVSRPSATSTGADGDTAVTADGAPPITASAAVADMSATPGTGVAPPPLAAEQPVAGRPQRQRRRPARYCCFTSLTKMEKKVSDHLCPECGFRYRTRGSCYKHAIKKHGKRYTPGQPLADIADDELVILRETYRRADMNPRQRAKAQQSSTGSASAGPSVRRRRRNDHTDDYRPPRRKRQRHPPVDASVAGPSTVAGMSATQGAGNCPAAASRATELELTELIPASRDDFEDLARTTDTADSLSAVSPFRGSPAPRLPVFTVRTSAARPAGGESSSSEEDLPGGISRQQSDVSDGQSTSPLRRRAARSPLQDADVLERQFEDTPSEALQGNAVASTRQTEPVERCVAGTQVQPECVDRAVDPPTVDELGSWQLPPQIDLRSLAVLLVQRPHVSTADLQRTAESVLPRVDDTAYGQSATRLAFLAMQAYEVEIARRLSDIVTVAYAEDATGWTGLRQCAAFLQLVAGRDRLPPPPPPPEDDLMEPIPDPPSPSVVSSTSDLMGPLSDPPSPSVISDSDSYRNPYSSRDEDPLLS